MFRDYEQEWFTLKKHINEQERLSKQETLNKMVELEIERCERRSKNSAGLE